MFKKGGAEMDFFNHYTVNTGHSTVQKPEDVSKKLYFILKDIAKELREEESAEILDDTYARLTEEEGCYALTLFADDDKPILTSIGCKDTTNEVELNKNIQMMALSMGIEQKVYLKAPFVADIIHAGVIARPDVMEWSGDFTRCMAWILLAPEKIR